MKKMCIRVCMLLLTASLLSLSACVELRNTTGYVATTETGIPTPIAAESASGTETVSDTDTTLSETASYGTAVNVDVDLTALSSTMVYAEVFNMMMDSNAYVGKTIKMRGSFAIGYSNNADGTMNTESIVFACVIADTTACCSQGIEFVLSGEHTYPDDYPALGSEITVVGTFTTYEEYGMLYCTLTDAVMEG